jgi:hypothetical protein
METFEIFRKVEAVLVKVTVMGVLVVPTFYEGKMGAPGERAAVVLKRTLTAFALLVTRSIGNSKSRVNNAAERDERNRHGTQPGEYTRSLSWFAKVVAGELPKFGCGLAYQSHYRSMSDVTVPGF